MITGYDTSFAPPDPAAMYGDGFRFVARYVGAGTAGKHLSKRELDGIRSAGLALVLVCEGATDDALLGYRRGVAHATKSAESIAALGLPQEPKVYFAVDFDARSSDMRVVSEYLDGAAGVLGIDRTGVYGSYAVVKHMMSAGVVKYGWQTYAWSRGRWFPGAQLRQVRNGVHRYGGAYDICEAHADDYGQIILSGESGIGMSGITARDVWEYKIGSAGLDVAPRAAWDWLKAAESAARSARQAAAAVDAMASDVAALRTDVAGLRAELARVNGDGEWSVTMQGHYTPKS